MPSSGITTRSLFALGLLGVSGLPGVAHAQNCQFPSREFDGSAIVSDRTDGVSSDGRGPYIKGKGGVVDSRAGSEGALTLYDATGTPFNSRTFSVNLSKPVPGGGGVPLGTLTSNVNGSGFITQRGMVGDTVQNLTDIAVGQTVTAAQMNIDLRIAGRFHVLQMGPQAHGHCMTNKNRVHGNGSSSGTITRASPTRWAMDLPAGSIGRLWDTEDGHERAVDKGLYYVQLHYEIIDAVPRATNVLWPLAEAKGGSAVVARYRALKRDSSTAYGFDQRQLNQIGYSLLKRKDANGAVLVFRLNVEEYPEAANPYDSLGDAYLATGDTASAVANYKRALQIAPGNKSTGDKLRRLGGMPQANTSVRRYPFNDSMR
jgi:hypothetical protein